MTTTTDHPSSVRFSAAHLLGWLTSHPSIRPKCVVYLDDETVEIDLHDGRYDALAAAADVAEALMHTRIDVVDLTDRRIAELRIYGCVMGTTLETLVTVGVYAEARARLLSSLGAPPNPGVRAWITSAAHLRSLAPGAVAVMPVSSTGRHRQPTEKTDIH